MLGLTVMFVALIGSASSAVTAEPVRLRILAGDQSGAYQALADRFNAESPGAIAEVESASGNYEGIILKILRGQVVGNTPDVAFQGYNFIRQTADWNVGVALDKRIADDPTYASLGLMPELQGLCEWGGRTWGLPFATSLPVIYYNSELVRRAGGDPDHPPTTWPAIIDLATRIHAVGGPNLVPIYFTYASSGNWTFKALIESQGGQMMSPDETKIAFDGPEGLRTLQILHDIGNAGFVDMSREQAMQGFAAGAVGIMIETSSRLGNITREAGGRVAFRTGPFPVPGPNPRLPAGGNCVVVTTKDPERQNHAWEFLKFAASPTGQTILVQNSGYTANNWRAINDPALLGTFYAQNPNYMTAVRQMPLLGRSYTFPGENAIKITEVIRGHLQAVLTLAATPEEAMTAMVADVKALLPAS